MYIKKIVPVSSTKKKIITEEGISFCLYNKEVNTFELEENEYFENLYEKIYPVLKERIYKRLLYLLSARDYNSHTLRRKLMESYPEGLVEEAVEFAVSKHYIDDMDYIERYINANKTKKSKLFLKNKLTEKGFDKKVIDVKLEELHLNEYDNIEALLRKKDYYNLSDADSKRKVINYLLRQGYRYCDIKEFI